MNKQSLIIFNIPVLFKILNEIKASFNFELFEFRNLNDLENLTESKYGNYLIVTNTKIPDHLNLRSIYLTESPSKIKDIVEKFNIHLLKNKFVNQNPKIPFIDSLILKEAKNITNIEVNHQERFEGKSNYDIKKLFILWFDMIENYHFYPLRFGSIVGLISFCIVKLLRIFSTKKSFSFEIKEKTF